MTYKLTKEGYIKRDDGACIPVDDKNSHYKEYLDWVDAGNVPDPIDPPTQAELDLETTKEQTRQDILDAKVDTKFQNLISKTPTQVKNWVKNSFPSLTLAEQNDLATIVTAVSILGRSL